MSYRVLLASLFSLFLTASVMAGHTLHDDKEDKKITLEKIMSDPDWMGRLPSNEYWDDDSQHIYYTQKRLGSSITDLYKQSLSTNNATVVSLTDMHKYAYGQGVMNADYTMKAYSYRGNIFLKDLKTNTVSQITQSSYQDSQPQFITGHKLAFRRGTSFFLYDIANKHLRELVSLKNTDAPKDIEDPEGFLAQEQQKLIDFIAKNHATAKDRESAEKMLQEQNKSLTPKAFYFGKNTSVAGVSLSPTGDKLLVRIVATTKANPNDVMPNYITENGNIAMEPVRSRVADSKPTKETLYYLDLTQHSKTELKYDTLPDYDADVLAAVKQENARALGKDYTSEKKPRHINALLFSNGVKWHPSGETVAFFIRAWDNKDQWLVTVNFEESTLETQHHYHDDAWVNYRFREFLWLKNTKTLYFLTEETGYSQLFSKELGQKQQQKTSGTFVVSDLQQSNDGKYIYYRANKKHPGIYEIYRLTVKTGKSEAITNLGGMNTYTLSPDNKMLLIQHSTTTMPPELYIQPIKKGATAKRLTFTISEEFLSYNFKAPEIVAIPSENTDQPIYSRLYLPIMQKGDAKRKAVMFTHGAGYLQNAHQGWSSYFREYMFNNMLAQQGYVVMDMDYRASAGYGRDWRTAIYRDMGTPELEDLRTGVNWMVANANVDRNRIGTYGGSYGGFLTLMAMFKQPDLFEAGAALRLVSDWAYYNHGYTSNILNKPEDDPIAYRRSSPIYFAEGLQKHLLINAPMVDDNVFFQDTVRLVQRLIELEKQNFETAIFPVEPHGFRQPSSWLDEYRRIYKLFEDTL